MHTFHLFRTRTWFFIPLLIGGYCEYIHYPNNPQTSPVLTYLPVELVGYIGRAMSSKQSPDWTIGPYVMQSTLLLIAPALFAASIYMELGRIIIMVKGEQFSLIRVNWMTKIFVTGDVLSFLMQASGMVSSPSWLFRSLMLIYSHRCGNHGHRCKLYRPLLLHQHRPERYHRRSHRANRLLWFLPAFVARLPEASGL